MLRLLFVLLDIGVYGFRPLIAANYCRGTGRLAFFFIDSLLKRQCPDLYRQSSLMARHESMSTRIPVSAFCSIVHRPQNHATPSDILCHAHLSWPFLSSSTAPPPTSAHRPASTAAALAVWPRLPPSAGTTTPAWSSAPESPRSREQPPGAPRK